MASTADSPHEQEWIKFKAHTLAQSVSRLSRAIFKRNPQCAVGAELLTLPGIGSANRLPLWFTILVLSRDIAIVLTVAVVNLAIGPRTFRPSIFGKIATATYIMTGVVTLYFNYLDLQSVVITVFVYASLVITFVSAFHYLIKVVHLGH